VESNKAIRKDRGATPIGASRPAQEDLIPGPDVAKQEVVVGKQKGRHEPVKAFPVVFIYGPARSTPLLADVRPRASTIQGLRGYQPRRSGSSRSRWSCDASGQAIRRAAQTSRLHRASWRAVFDPAFPLRYRAGDRDRADVIRLRGGGRGNPLARQELNRYGWSDGASSTGSPTDDGGEECFERPIRGRRAGPL